MSLLLSCQSLAKSYGPRMLFKDISISFDDTERTGLIGPNGSGKSTLLKILAQIEQPDDGSITMRRQLRLGYLPQEDSFPPGHTVHQVLLDALADRNLDDHESQRKIEILLDRIGLKQDDANVDSLSGGWRKRLALRGELIREPDLLLLDEPTNHLDLEGIIWLEELLSNARFSFLLVSHDRYFLENVTNRIVELNTTYADGYLSINGSYSDFLVKRDEYLEAQAARQQALASRVRREVEWLHRGAKARTTKAKGRIQQAGQMMEDLAELKARNTQQGAVQIDFSATNRQTRKLLTAKNVKKLLGGRLLFDHLNMVISPGTRIGLLGRTAAESQRSSACCPDNWSRMPGKYGLPRDCVWSSSTRTANNSTGTPRFERRFRSTAPTPSFIAIRGCTSPPGPDNFFFAPSNSTCRCRTFPAASSRAC